VVFVLMVKVLAEEHRVPDQCDSRSSTPKVCVSSPPLSKETAERGVTIVVLS
jgi:hypothetical protein